MTISDYRRAVVTGATSGIGAAVVRSLATRGVDVLAVGRRRERLEILARETGCQTAQLDLADPGETADSLVVFEPDILVNNAGVGHGITGLLTVSPPEIETAVAVNVLAPIRLTAALLPGMRARGRGHIINIGSISGLHNVVSSLYGAAKSAIHRFSQNLRVELKGTPIRVTELCPGRVASEFVASAAGDAEALGAFASSGIVELQPEDIAEALVFAIQAPPHVNVSTIEILPTEQTVGGATFTPVNWQTVKQTR